MKYFITFAGLAATASAVGVTTVNPKCNFDYCLRNVIASNLPTRSGYADCVAFLQTTVIPAPATSWSTTYTTGTTTAPVSTITTSADYVPPIVDKRYFDFVQDFQNGGFRMVRRDEATGPVTITNTMPDYMIKSCTSLNGVEATARYASACSCVGATPGEPNNAPQPTITKTSTLEDPTATSATTPLTTVTVLTFKAEVTGAPTAAANKFLSTSVISGNTHIVAAAVATAAPNFVLYPNGKILVGGKRLIAKVSGPYPDSRYLDFIDDNLVTPGTAFDVVCEIGGTGLFTCKSAPPTNDHTKWILLDMGGGAYTLRLLKTSAAVPAPNFDGFTIKALAPNV
ncbi:hypothetical protein TWF730_008783 [Orbilia blumenaviensis]|uniref:Uncharacterized protein n=1 Tax=Orbilia blumenaviensis TaxID=1796055 RepID=A0AAV9V467_9PEZI